MLENYFDESYSSVAQSTRKGKEFESDSEDDFTPARVETRTSTRLVKKYNHVFRRTNPKRKCKRGIITCK